MRPLPFEFNGVVRFTRVGAAYLLSTLVIGVAALNTGNNALYIALSLLLATLILSGIASKDGLRHITVEFVGMGEAWAQCPARGVLRVANRSRIWNVRDLILVSPSLAYPVLLDCVSRRQEIDVDVEFLFMQRGRTRLARIDLYTRFPFGLFLKKRRIPIAGDTIVYPQLRDAAPEEVTRAASRGEMDVEGRTGSGSELFGFREYSLGDSLRQVHWKKSAALGRWIMKEHQSEAGHLLLVVVDPMLPPDRARDEFEEMLSLAATLIHGALREQRQVVLRIGAEAWKSSMDPSARSLFEALALVETTSYSVLPPQTQQAMVFSLREMYATRSA